MNTLSVAAALLLAPLSLVQAAPASATAPARAAAPVPVTVALDWVPNLNHIGLYVAQARGWYAAAGLKVTLLPYGSVSPDTLVLAGKADLGISGAEGVTTAVAAGQPLVSVAAIYATNTASFAVLDGSDIRRPRDFDGRVYAAFGAPYETPILQTMIRRDGGQGTFRSPALNVFGLDALLAKRADFMWVFGAVEGVQARRTGHPLRTFSMKDYGVPDYYTPVFTADRRTLPARRDRLRAFMAATARGYDYARTHPAEAARLMIDTAPKGSFPDPSVLREGLAELGRQGAYRAPGRPWGEQTLKMWTEYPAFLLKAGAVKLPNGQSARQLDFRKLFTDELLRR